MESTPEVQATPQAAAVAVIELARQGRFAEITALFAPPLRPMVPPEALRAAWAQIAASGPVAEVGPPVPEQAGPGTVTVKIPLSFTGGTAVTVVVGVTAGEHNWITGVQTLPPEAAEPVAAWEPP